MDNRILRQFDGGLVMRRAAPADVERVARFNAGIHGDDPVDGENVGAWTRDLFQNMPPSFKPDDFLIVEETSTGEIVSSLNLISQTWQYEGIPFGVGRPELVGTDERYRNRGLVRAQFEVVHEWSRERGELVQVITGIPYFYRQFGYEMALNLSGGRTGYEPHLPALAEGKDEPFLFRPASESDLPYIMKMYEREAQASMISSVLDEELWRCELFMKSPNNVNRQEIRIIETTEGCPVGFLAHPWYAWGTMQAASAYRLDEGVSYLEVTPSVIRYLWKIGKENAKKREKTLMSFGFWFGSQHPAYQAAADNVPVERSPYAYYVRVPDLPAFLERITPALEERFAKSVCAGHSGELKVGFYRDGVRFVLEKGKIVCVEAWKPKIRTDEGAAAFPGMTFLQLVFGYRGLQEIGYAFPDQWANREAKVLLTALFPKKHSNVWVIS